MPTRSHLITSLNLQAWNNSGDTLHVIQPCSDLILLYQLDYHRCWRIFFLLLNLRYTFRQVSKILLCKNRGLLGAKVSVLNRKMGGGGSNWDLSIRSSFNYFSKCQIAWYLLLGKLSPLVRKVLIRNVYGKKIRLKFLHLARSDFEPPSYFVICSNLAGDLTRASG